MEDAVEAIEWLYEKGHKQLDAGHYQEARTRFKRILNMTRQSGWVEKANAGLARIYLAEENYFWAMDHVRRALKRGPNNPEYRYIKGKVHLDREEWEEAASEALKAVESDLESGRFYQLLGNAAYHCEGYRVARRFLEWAVECSPENTEIRLDLAKLEISEDNYQNALGLLKDSLEVTSEQDKIREAIRRIQENWKLKGVENG